MGGRWGGGGGEGRREDSEYRKVQVTLIMETKTGRKGEVAMKKTTD